MFVSMVRPVIDLVMTKFKPTLRFAIYRLSSIIIIRNFCK